ncbi:MAG: hypothetical protein K8F27_08695 [Sulfuricellaceae bacterium]|nr:hypothetical protein [Sulfuricellaceae bacterium]
MPPADDVFDKLDSLLSRHRSPGSPSQVFPEEYDIPILTEEVRLDALETAPLPVLVDEVMDSIAAEIAEPPPASGSQIVGDSSPPPIPDADQTSPARALPSHHLEQFILETVERRIAPKLASKLDLALGELLEQFKIEINALVKQAIAQEMQQYLESFEQDLSRHGASDSSH